jgi:hypothetical protein
MEMLVGVHVSSVRGGVPSGILPELWGAEKGHEYPGREQKQVKRAANKMRFGRGANVHFHLAYASVRKHF